MDRSRYPRGDFVFVQAVDEVIHVLSVRAHQISYGAVRHDITIGGLLIAFVPGEYPEGLLRPRNFIL